MAEWLGSALQKLLQRFESASDLYFYIALIDIVYQGDIFLVVMEKADVNNSNFLK